MTDRETTRLAAIDLLVGEVASRRSRGEYVSDRQIMDAHPELMPELAEELTVLQDLGRAALAARKAGPVAAVRPLEAHELAEPISLGDEPEAVAEPEQRPRPAIYGYTLVAEISYGGQATVYQAVQESTGRKVAIKVLLSGAFAGSRSRRRFDQERQILASLSHPNLVSILDAGSTADGSVFLAMPFVDGCGLDEHLALMDSRDPQFVRDLLALFVKIADAVGEAHSQGVVHRDLKPSNVRVDRRGEPYVLDFGLAQLLNPEAYGQARPVTLSGQMIGSVPWFSPEQARGGKLDQRSDVYALGVMLYQGATGQWPYPVFGPLLGVLNHVAVTVPKPPSAVAGSYAPLITPALDAIILKALAKQPAGRHASASELANELRDLAAAGPVGFRPRRPPRRGAAVLAASAICLTAMAALAIWVWPNPARQKGGAQAALGPQSAPSAAVTPTATPAKALPNVRRPVFTNSVGMQFVQIEPGRFVMGSPYEEEGRRDDEIQHLVIIGHPFLLATTATTNRQFFAVLGRRSGNPQLQEDDLPVEEADWFDAQEFCQELYRRERRVYRLPTEAEWEYACRAGTIGPYGGNGQLGDMGWYQENDPGRPQPVGRKMPNAWGLYEMQGGVREWCSDWYGPYSTKMVQDPQGARTSFHRVIRGASRFERWNACRSAYRGANIPTLKYRSLGFRVVLESTEPRSPDAPPPATVPSRPVYPTSAPSRPPSPK